MRDSLFTVAVILACVVVAELLCKRTVLRHGGTALVVIVVTAVVSNVGIIPTSVTPIYAGVLAYVAPLAIFWLLLQADLRRVLDAGLPLLGTFLVGALGTVVGAAVGVLLVGVDSFGAHGPALAGMFAATYVGGSANFNALALHYHVLEEPALYAGSMAVDAGLTALWMVVTIAWPRLVRARNPTQARAQVVPDSEPSDDSATIAPLELAVLLGLGVAALWVSERLASAASAWGASIPSILILTTIALGLAQLRSVGRLAGAPLLGMTAVYVFLAVIGALCDLGALAGLGMVGLKLAGLAFACVTVHALATLGGAAVLGLDPVVAAVASQANIGGGATALVVARSVGRRDLCVPAILVGSLGTALGTFLGFSVAMGLA